MRMHKRTISDSMKEWIKETRVNFYGLCEYVYSSKSATYKEKSAIEKLQKEFEENIDKIEKGHLCSTNKVLYQITVALSYYN